MQLKQSQRQQVKLRLGLSGASGFGKTKSALLLAYGMTQDWSKIAVIDTENSSASLYSDLGSYNVLDLQAPYSPERYIQAIELCEKSGIEVIIIDSASHEWNGSGGCLEIHEKLGGRFQDWANVTPRHQAFINKILQSSCHIITTTRRKMDYSLDIGSNGKTKVVKHGTKEITRDGFEYELTINFELVNDNHLAKASKDRTGLFMNKPEFLITSQTGKMILDWCNTGEITKLQVTSSTSEQSYLGSNEINNLINKIESCNTIAELLALYKQYPDYQEKLKSEYEVKKSFLIKLSNPQNFSTNGVHR
ncbi:signal recognition particle subunit FFH/SRP54 (srp54) [Chryseobacterium wanjuense]|uniref:Signal recognition particle subunit FFH/SRP54 (Srp54) n=1 Tax=Chryseobacterium wanjuense TaxID=356305 RepID=A0A1I0S481_9FLAO|nr:AAA family ATPase [Chryseobacterium wanjuense]SEW49594.1 signal recognition particle subunit FFH/SRP54 (srp54) [Chryseobacterium wanjuense]